METELYSNKLMREEFRISFPRMPFLRFFSVIRFAFALIYPKYGVLYFHRQHRRLSRKGYRFSRLYFLLNHYLNAVEINVHATLEKNVTIPHPFGVVIGGKSVVGENTVILSGVTLGANSASNGSYTYPKLGSGCYIGTGAKIIGGINIGKNVVVGANSVVLKDVCENTTVAGIPARKLSNRQNAE